MQLHLIFILKCVLLILQPIPTEEQNVIIKRAALDLRKKCSDVVFPAVEKVISILAIHTIILFHYTGIPDQTMTDFLLYLYFHIEIFELYIFEIDFGKKMILY